MLSVVLVGALGRMGAALESAAAAAADVRVKGRVDARVAGGEAAGAPGAGSAVAPPAALARLVAPGDVVIEFSSPEGCREAARACAERGAGLVSGTTGLRAEDESAVEAAARRVAVLRAANFSLGVLALRRSLAAALDALPPDWDIEIVERHHRAKVDSPSGTARMLALEAARRRGLAASALRSGREGAAGPRPADEIGVHAVRGGSWVGDHCVLIAGRGEWLELRHAVADRAAFAEGALAAARFLVGKGPGLYTLDDVLARRRGAD